MDEEKNKNTNISDDLIAQQPLMAALNESTQEPPKEEVQPVQTPSVVPEQKIVVPNVQPVSESVVANDNPVEPPVQNDSLNNMNTADNNPIGPVTKKNKVIPIVIAVLVLVVLGVGGYFGSKLIQKHEKENMPKLVYYEEATDFYLDKYDLIFEPVENTAGSYQAKNEKYKVLLRYDEKDEKKKLVHVIIATPKSFDDAFDLAKPFFYSFDSYDEPRKMMSLAEKYGAVNYNVGKIWIEFSSIIGNPSIEIALFDELSEEEKSIVKIVNDNEVLLSGTDGEFSFKIINNIKNVKLKYINIYPSKIDFKYGTYEFEVDMDYKDTSMVEEMNTYHPTNTVEKDFNGQKILVAECSMGTKIWIPVKKENIDINSSEKKKYLFIELDSYENVDTVLSNLSRKK